MFTLGLIHTPERKEVTTQVAKHYESLKCQKLLISTGEDPWYPDGFETINVHKQGQWIRRADIWNALCKSATYPTVAYLDCDRIVDLKFFESFPTPMAVKYPKCMWQFGSPISNYIIDGILDKQFDAKNYATIDYRVELTGFDLPAKKTACSGCLMFNVADYFAIGGMDDQWVGWGFSDTDLYMKMWYNGFHFDGTDDVELHLWHEYEANFAELLSLYAWNGVRCYDKWFLPLPLTLLQTFNQIGLTINELRSWPLSRVIKHTSDHLSWGKLKACR